MTFLKHVLLVGTLTALLVSCGKDEKKSGSTPAYYPLNSTISESGAQALASLVQWHNAGESSQYSIGLYKSSSSTSGFNLNGFICFNNCLSSQYPKCFIRGVNGNYSTGSTTSSNNIPQCSTNLVELPKSANTVLTSAVTGNNGSLVLVSATRQGNVFTVTWRNPSSFAGDTSYVIDISMPSAINPVASLINGQTTQIQIGSLQ